MAQTQSPTNEGYGEIGKLMAGEGANCVKSVCCIQNACTANASQTNAGVNWFTGSGLSLVDANTVVSSNTTTANDTVELDHVFTANGSANALGFGILNDTDDVLFALCCFAAAVAVESADTLTVEMKMQFKLGA